METAWILAGVSASCWALFVYPYAVYPLALRALSKRPIRKEQTELSVSLLFCAYNEIESLPSKIENLRALKRSKPDLQIVAYDDGSDDGTYELMTSVPELLSAFRGPGRTGKAAGMKHLVRQATGQILIFTDANVLIAFDAIDRLLPYYADPDVGGVCGTLMYSSDPRSVTAQIGSLYWGLDETLRTLESATGNVMGADGSLFSVRRSLYPDFPDTVLDDLTVSMNVIFRGKRLIKAPDVIAHEKGVARRTEELRRKIRIGARAYHTHAYLRPQLREMAARDRFKYMSRKLVRWFGGLFLACGAISALAAVTMVSRLAAAAMAIALMIAIISAFRSRNGYLAKGGEIILATFATFIGVVQGMRGQTMATWAPAKSR